jgi:acetyl-CoA synthetase
LQRSHSCAQHNAGRNAHNLENAFAVQLGKALAPSEIIFVGDIPKTRNAKVMRRIVRAAYLGEKLGDTSALENPASLDEIARRRVGRVTPCAPS